MSKYKYSETERQINSVLKHHDEDLKSIHFPSLSEADATVAKADALLRRLGYQPDAIKGLVPVQPRKTMVIPTWEQCCAEAETHVGTDCELESLFTEEELRSNELAIKQLNEEFNAVHRLDAFDISIAALAGLVGAAVDILLVGIPQKTPDGLKGGPLSNYVRDYFDKKFPEEEMQKLANSKVSKVPYDAQDNRHTTIRVEGLSAYYHRLLQLGHDPLLGFVFGVADILTGRMTTIDKAGNIVSQVMENYADRKESDIFAALAKQVIHFKSDVTTSMGLPVPLMSLFKGEHITHASEQQNIVTHVWCILHFFDKFGFTDGGMQLLQKEVTTFTFFHLGNRIGNVQIITEGKKDFIEITFDQTALERRVGPKLIEKMHHRDFFGSVVTKNTDIDLITQALSIQKVILLDFFSKQVEPLF